MNEWLSLALLLGKMLKMPSLKHPQVSSQLDLKP